MIIPTRILAYVRDSSIPSGPILEAEGEAFEESAWDIGDLDITAPEREGIQIFEGCAEYSNGPDPDVMYRGAWRRLTHWEMCRLQHEMIPWGKEDK